MNDMVDLIYTLILTIGVTYILYRIFGRTDKPSQKKENKTHHYAIAYFFYDDRTATPLSHEVMMLSMDGPMLSGKALMEVFYEADGVREEMKEICIDRGIDPSNVFCGFYSITYLGYADENIKGLDVRTRR